MLAGNLIHNLQVGMEISGDILLASQSRNERYEFSIIKQTQFFVKKIDKTNLKGLHKFKNTANCHIEQNTKLQTM